MVYVRSRKFCCCLPVRFGVFCESLLGLGLGGFVAIAAWIQIHAQMEGTLELEQDQKVAVWFVAVSMTIFALTSLMGLVGAIGRLRALVGTYFAAITFVTVVEIIAGSYLIFQLFAGKTDEQIKECEARVADSVNENLPAGVSANSEVASGTNDFTNWACSASFKTGRIIVVVLYVIFWLIAIYGCYIAYEYFGQLKEEAEARRRDAEKSQAANVTIVSQPQYAFASQPNAYGPPSQQATY